MEHFDRNYEAIAHLDFDPETPEGIFALEGMHILDDLELPQFGKVKRGPQSQDIFFQEKPKSLVDRLPKPMAVVAGFAAAVALSATLVSFYGRPGVEKFIGKNDMAFPTKRHTPYTKKKLVTK